MASDLSFTEAVAVATLVVAILAVLLVLPYILVAFGFFPDSGFAHRVHPLPNPLIVDILQELRLQKDLAAIRNDIETMRQNTDFALDWFETQTDAILEIVENVKEKMD